MNFPLSGVPQSISKPAVDAQLTSPTIGNRLAWVDTAKSVAIILVVIYHVSVVGVARLLPDADSAILSFWDELSRMLLPVRMPLFFLVAGLLAARAVWRPWKDLWRRRLADLLWPFLLWSILFAAVTAFAYRPSAPRSYFWENLAAIPFGGTAYWFLSLLVGFFVVTKLLRHWPGLMMLTAFFLLMVTPFLKDQLQVFLPDALVINILRGTVFLFWYVTGCFAAAAVRAIAAANPWPLVGAAFVLYAALTHVVNLKNAGLSLNLALSVVGIVGVLVLSRWASKFRWVRSASTYIAGRTLPIYVVHPIVLNALIAVSIALGEGSTVLPSSHALLNSLIVPALVAICVTVAVVLYDLTAKTPLQWIFQFPQTSRARKSL